MVDGCVACPDREKIDKVYKDFYVGNGEAAIRGRVRSLEGDMSEIIPILRALQASDHDRQLTQTTRDSLLAEQTKSVSDKLDVHYKKNATRTALLVLVFALLELFLHGADALRAWKSSLNEMPSLHTSAGGSEYAAHRSPPQDAGARPTAP